MALEPAVLSAGSADGVSIAMDDMGADGRVQLIKPVFGADGSFTIVSAANPMPVVQTGTNTVELGATDNAVLDAIAASVAAIDTDATTIIGHVDGLEALIGTTNSTLTTIDGRVDGIEALLTTIDADTSNLSVVGGGTEATAIRVTIANNSTGVLSIDDNGANISIDDGGNVITVDGTVDLGATDNAVLDAIAASVAAIDTDATTIIGHVDGIETALTAANSSLDAIEASTAASSTAANQATIITAVQLIDDIVYTDDTSTHATGTSKGALIMAAATPTDTAVSANDIGAVAMTTNRGLHVSVQDAIPAGNNNIGDVDIASGTLTTVSTVTTVSSLGVSTTGPQKLEDVGAAGGDAGISILGVRVDTPNVALTNTDADYGWIALNKLGSVRTAYPEDDLATAATKHVYKYYTNAGAVTDGIIWSPAAGARWFLSSLTINTSAAAVVTIEDDVVAGDVVRFKFEFAANSGIHMDFPIPMFSGEDAADLLVTTSAGNIYITAVGYEI